MVHVPVCNYGEGVENEGISLVSKVLGAANAVSSVIVCMMKVQRRVTCM